MNAVVRLAARAIGTGRGLILLALLLILAQPLIPTTSWLARDDLLPWICLSLSLVALFRADAIGPGPHPLLRQRRSPMGALARRVALGLVPWGMLAAFDLGAHGSLEGLALAAGAIVVTGTLLVLGRRDGLTAWAPAGISSFLVWGGVGTVAFGAAYAGGQFSTLLPALSKVGFQQAMMLGQTFLTVALAAGRTTHLRQRRAIGRRDGRRISPLTFSLVLALVGPGVGFFAISLVFSLISGHDLSFSDAYVVPLFVCMWAAILWRDPLPVAVGCLLHEVLPEGGSDAEPDGRAVSFEQPPEGALRFNPLRVKRAQVVHSWIVPVRRSRIGELDDPIAPLWDTPVSPSPAHVLGEAAFEPDAFTGSSQWEAITIRLGSRSDTAGVTEQDAQTRRVVVLRAFPRLGGAGRSRLATYRWQRTVPEESVQVLDATTERCVLLDGDILVVAAEGVARAYELEIGAPVTTGELLQFRPPQVEDYAEVAR